MFHRLVRLAGVLALAIVLLLPASVADAAQSPAGCTSSGLVVDLFANRTSAQNGETITYSVKVTNSGSTACDVANATVSLTLPALAGSATGSVVTLVSGAYFGVGANTTYTHNYVVNVNAGVTSVTAKARVTGQLQRYSDFVQEPQPVVDRTDTTTVGITTPQPQGGEGCTPGFWKNHPNAWRGFSTTQTVKSVFSGAGTYSSLGNATLMNALGFQGSSTLQGAAEILLRASVAAMLNAAHPDVDYAYSMEYIRSSVNAALTSSNRDAMISLAAKLDSANNAGCFD